LKWVKYDKEKDRIPAKFWCDDVEEGAMEQIVNLTNHPAVVKHVAAMPGLHLGYGMPIECVIACKDAIIPNAVGKDVGCGMRCVKTSLKKKSFFHPTVLENIIKGIKNKVPVGKDRHKVPQENNLVMPGIIYPIMEREERKIDYQLGTLGGGNHFIEIQYDVDTDDVYFMIHSGSRNFGSKVANHYNDVAVKLNDKWHVSVDPSWELAFLPIHTYEAKAYLAEMEFAMEFAFENRRLISERVKESFISTIDCQFEEDLDINHNYAAYENHFGQNLIIHRKGATRARKGEIGIIPGSMGTASYIVEGLGNRDSFNSCSHGAGRVMGRNDASNRLNVVECNEAMDGIIFDGWGTNRKGQVNLGEAPQAYKDIEDVMKAQKDLVTPIVKLKPLGVVKAIEKR